MSWIYKINSLPLSEKAGIYRLLIPPTLYRRYKINPLTFVDPEGERVVRFYCPRGEHTALVEVKRRCDEGDPIYSIQVSDATDPTMLNWDFVILNDVESERFGIDVDSEGRDTLFGRAARNLAEEKRALESGLAPGQVRPGLRLTGEVVAGLDHLCKILNLKSIFLEALFYHNAIVYEKYGFTYFKGHKFMAKLNEAFQPGGPVHARLDGSSPYRRPGCEQSVRARSWAIHDGILDGVADDELGDGWLSPTMYRMVDTPRYVTSFPDGTY